MKNLVLQLFILILSGCSTAFTDSSFIGFWEGPHPENPNKKFYIHINQSGDTIKADGYWTFNNFYQEHFEIDSLTIRSNEISFKIPLWACVYSGKRVEKESIFGRFKCEGEPFDSVRLVKNDSIENFLIYAKPECKKPNYKYLYSEPLLLNDGIRTSKLNAYADSLFIQSVLTEIIDGEYGRINSFLLFKNNALVCEEYLFGYTQNDLHQIESCTKSITSLLIGIAKDKKLISNTDQPIHEIFDEYFHLKMNTYNQIRIDHLLSMTSGFNPGSNSSYQSPESIDLALKREMNNEPGKTFQYDGGNTEILGAILKKKTSLYADEFARKYFFEPLEIIDYQWVALAEGKYPCMAGSLELKPRDFLKAGILVLNKGQFNGQQVISEEWIRESTSVKTNTNIPDQNYGYLWWLLNLESEGNHYQTIWANGWGSQFLYIFPEIDVVIAVTGHNYENDSWAITKGISKYLYLLDSGTTAIH